ncbi:cell division protein ZapE [Ectothiorhodospira variabilis]|uniref:cell division protein ZapE n=1 Tax=Ectothiorhodospira variabilis TaxID=505694 RepID=UPI001EFA4856|nr:cell division protein ZapE [Ectothiorhodospira variabilis]MCG5493883.1 cell division protein ZapE [Ectothiorhodospira variabilis]MCG5498097.1 cell division protein ZapE [Ectothiorhodospira variabilis]MCG5503686.1 cell division protein ZapE [Ectothiorhodospira variabilis]MCG5506842.1 cell division protein ZapE [Ectothiorhodospira variabilis]
MTHHGRVQPEHPTEIQLDPAQEQALARLRRISDDLEAAPRPKRPGPLARLLGRGDVQEPVRGLYLWGDVGRGKTYLVDRFFDELPIEDKTRLHFHRFMQKVHAELGGLKDQSDPIAIVAKRMARARLLCLDEFFVSDITDAVLLHRLLAGLMDNGVCLVTTSNLPPDELYKDGLQRDLFLPAIGLIKRNLEVFHLDGDVDYRLRSLQQARIYHTPSDEASRERLISTFNTLAPDAPHDCRNIKVEGRKIPVQRCADGVVWFRFADLCEGPRSQVDYVEIAREFHSVLIADVPVMDNTMDDAARRFLALVDEFYDRKVNLIIAAEARPEALYQGQRLRFEYQRCVSRLLEMQSEDYLAQPHRP